MISVCLAMLADDEEKARFLEIYAEHEILVQQTAISYIRDPSLVEDAMQECWLRTAMYFQKIKRLEREKVGGYLVILTRNVCYDMNKKESAYETFPEDWEPAAPPEQNDVIHRIKKLIRTMPSLYREILEEKYILGYNNREISKIHGLKESTVATRVQRGRTMLADMLKKEGFDATEWNV